MAPRGSSRGGVRGRRQLSYVPPRKRAVDAASTINPLEAVQAAYARNVFVATSLRRLERVHLRSLDDADLAQDWARAVRCRRCDEDEDRRFAPDHLKEHLREWLRRHGEPRPVPRPRAPFAANLRFIGEVFGLAAEELAVLQFAVAVHYGDPLREIVHSVGEVTLSGLVATIAAATRVSQSQVSEGLKPSGRLLSSALLSVDTNRNLFCSKVQLHSVLNDVLFLPDLDHDRLVRAFLEPAAAATLCAEDFADLDSLRTARELLASALPSGAHGVNVLLYGPTGVGKTELTRVLGREVAAQVFVVGKADSQGDPATPAERLMSLRVAHQLAPRGRSILLFDELEDLFRWEPGFVSRSRATPQMSKQWFGALLEENPIPTVWCTNRVDGVDEAFLRRFTFAIELKPAGARQRARVVAHHAPEIAPSDASAIAQRFDVPPAQLATAVRAARLVAGGAAPNRRDIERFLAPAHKLLNGRDRPAPAFESVGYRLDALNCDEDLVALVDRIAEFRPDGGPGVSLCLYGPPGVGKSELVTYLAWRRGAPVVHRRVSDLVSCYVGQTEQNIARAFEEARQDGAVLVFDEADSFLRDRSAAQRSWEVTEVNEFLQQLEAFPGIVACTTNLWQDLDAAALRRFVFKIELRYPTAAQAVELFRSFFPAALVPAEEAFVGERLRELPNLAPGDFAAVARRVRVLRVQPNAEALLAMLAREAAVKRDAVVRPVGFLT